MGSHIKCHVHTRYNGHAEHFNSSSNQVRFFWGGGDPHIKRLLLSQNRYVHKYLQLHNERFVAPHHNPCSLLYYRPHYNLYYTTISISRHATMLALPVTARDLYHLLQPRRERGTSLHWIYRSDQSPTTVARTLPCQTKIKRWTSHLTYRSQPIKTELLGSTLPGCQNKMSRSQTTHSSRSLEFLLLASQLSLIHPPSLQLRP